MTSGNAAKWQIEKRRDIKKKGVMVTLPLSWENFAKDLCEEFTLINNKGKAGTDLMMIKQGN